MLAANARRGGRAPAGDSCRGARGRGRLWYSRALPLLCGGGKRWTSHRFLRLKRNSRSACRGSCGARSRQSTGADGRGRGSFTLSGMVRPGGSRQAETRSRRSTSRSIPTFRAATGTSNTSRCMPSARRPGTIGQKRSSAPGTWSRTRRRLLAMTRRCSGRTALRRRSSGRYGWTHGGSSSPRSWT